LQSHLGRVRIQSDIDYSLPREIYSQLHHARSKKLLAVCLQIHLGVLLNCSLAFSRISFALSHGQWERGSSPLFLPYLNGYAQKAVEHGFPDPTGSIIHAD